MSAATGGGMGIRRYTTDNEEFESADGDFILHSAHVAALQELQASNAELERIAARYRKGHSHHRYLCWKASNYDNRCATCRAYDLIAEGKIQPTEPGGQHVG